MDTLTTGCDRGQRRRELSVRKRPSCPENPVVPREDRLARQHEIFLAVAPLIDRYGARRLSMRQAAKAVHLSLGGLYHYFPTKRDLVLHALKPEALARVCADFHDRHVQWERTDHSRYVEANIAYMARQSAFIRPAFQAALDLDAEIAWDHIRAGIERGLDACTRPLTLALPTCTPDEIDSLGRSMRRTFYSALVDHTGDPGGDAPADALACPRLAAHPRGERSPSASHEIRQHCEIER